jgi:hypothetical protein
VRPRVYLSADAGVSAAGRGRGAQDGRRVIERWLAADASLGEGIERAGRGERVE